MRQILICLCQINIARGISRQTCKALCRHQSITIERRCSIQIHPPYSVHVWEVSYAACIDEKPLGCGERHAQCIGVKCRWNGNITFSRSRNCMDDERRHGKLPQATAFNEVHRMIFFPIGKISRICKMTLTHGASVEGDARHARVDAGQCPNGSILLH